MGSVLKLPRRETLELDRELARLGRGAGALRLQLGEALDQLAVQGGHHALGFSSLSAYALERCEKSGRWAIESRTVARRLEELPRLRAALRSGELSWSMVELVSRHASVENEAALVERARGCTVRQMREALKVGSEEETDEAEPVMRTLTVTVPVEDAWAFECSRLLVEHLEGGKASTDMVMTALLAEGEITLQGMVATEARDGRERSEDQAARAAEWLEVLARYRTEAEARCESRIPRGGSVEQGQLQEGVQTGDGDPIALDRCIRSLARELAERELALGRAAVRLFEANGWRRLGYATAGQYARERVGISYSALKSHMTLARRAVREPAVLDALGAGRIGPEAALLVGRVATPKTAEAWVTRAEQRTIKHLNEEVKAAELIARMTACGEVEPPDDELLSAVQEIESAVVSGRVYRDGFAAVEEAGQMSAQSVGVDERQMSAREDGDAPPRPRRGAGKITLRLRVSDETFRAYRALEQDYLRRAGCPLGFVGFLCVSLWDSWHAGLERKVAYGAIYARDRYRCSSPVCRRCDVTPHHLRFRSQGGDDSEENLSSLCVWCHLEGVHGGRIRALPPASSVRWMLGERPILIVHGRRKQEVDQAA